MKKLLALLLFAIPGLAFGQAQALPVQAVPINPGNGTVASFVTSVDIQNTDSLLCVSGGPVTTVGIFTINLCNQGGNKVIASPSDGSTGAMAARVLVTADMPATNLLNGTFHSDTAAIGAARGKLIFGNTAGLWSALTIGSSAQFLLTDGTDPIWGTVNTFTQDTLPDAIADYVPSYDTSAAQDKKILIRDLMVSDPRVVSLVREDFFGYTAVTTVFAGGLVHTVSGAAAEISLGTSTTTHPGVVDCTTGSTTTGRCGLINTASLSPVVFGGATVRYSGTFKVGAASSGAESYTLRAGFGDAVSAESTDAVFFRVNDAVNSGKWQGVARAAASETTCDTNVAQDTNYHTYDLEVNSAATLATFYIDGTSTCTVASNIPTGANFTTLLPFHIFKSAGSTPVVMSMDQYAYTWKFTTAR